MKPVAAMLRMTAPGPEPPGADIESGTCALAGGAGRESGASARARGADARSRTIAARIAAGTARRETPPGRFLPRGHGVRPFLRGGFVGCLKRRKSNRDPCRQRKTRFPPLHGPQAPALHT